MSSPPLLVMIKRIMYYWPIIQKFALTFLILGVSRFAMAQEIIENNLIAKRFSPIEIFVGAGIVSLRQGPADPHHQDVGDFGYMFGLGRRYILNDRFQIEGRIQYDRKGGKGLNDEQTGDTTTHTNVIHKGAIETRDFYNCLSVPIILCYDFGHKAKFQIKVGAYFSYLLKATYITKSSVTPQLHYSDDITNQMYNDFGFSVGFGFETPLPKGNKLSIQIISNWGLLNIAKPVNPLSPPDWKTNSSLIVVGIPLRSILKNNY